MLLFSMPFFSAKKSLQKNAKKLFTFSSFQHDKVDEQFCFLLVEYEQYSPKTQHNHHS